MQNKNFMLIIITSLGIFRPSFSKKRFEIQKNVDVDFDILVFLE